MAKAQSLLIKGFSVVIDRCHQNVEQREYFAAIARQESARVVYVFMETPLEECIHRVHHRQKHELGSSSCGPLAVTQNIRRFLKKAEWSSMKTDARRNKELVLAVEQHVSANAAAEDLSRTFYDHRRFNTLRMPLVTGNDRFAVADYDSTIKLATAMIQQIEAHQWDENMHLVR